MKTAIVWFKTDLRITDNEALLKATLQNESVIPIYCFDDSHFATTGYGFKKTGDFRGQFLIESLIDLDTNLRALGSGLLVLKGRPEIEIPKIVKQYKAGKVYAKREVAYEEKYTENLVKSELWKLQCEILTFSTSTLYHAEDLPFSIKNIPDVFTDFRKKVEKDSAIRLALEKPANIKSPDIPELDLPNLQQLGLQKISMDPRAAIQYIGGESQAIKRLNHYFFESRSISAYKETRNGMTGPDYSSKFSPWLALGCISPRFVYQELKKYESLYTANESTYWLVFELLWRDYFRFMMKKYHNSFFQKNGIKNTDFTSKPVDFEQLQNWIDGKTGVDFIDANMIELKLTGFMSNRGCQNAASYLCNDLALDWRYGAAYFEQQLIDYDVCSNWGNWAYLAGVGNDPRGNRYFNTEKQAADYDKNKTFRNLWLKD
ncbi:DASH family cryptochrome [Flavobacterium circumlabens]|uniref:Cryptochrome DASH n=1 Tax=Flavobacterium circumlabens TaxID=2133765 RepID=A0A4Y7U5X0_9FLAO|nr:DASH family cryptochrome [Flavobacterium circumlabens]TCN50679.1 deoxyribodipyrimidine photo-lyase [Flavobacterium circumlabens]TEB41840.1 DASH family cryptochrome [Flavobacterium circumlabens]